MDSDSSTLSGFWIGRYQANYEIGHGGFATVYHGQSEEGEQVAIKVLAPELAHDPAYFKRFEREARIVSQLEHPNILPILDFGEVNGLPYIVMPLIEGGSLAEYVADGRQLAVQHAAKVISDIAGALDYAHSQGVIHRDVKPANMLLAPKTIYLADFGIVKLLQHETHTLTKGLPPGTPPYMAPEYTRDGELTHLVDVYALAVTLFRLVTGRLPYQADNPVGVLAAHVTQPIPDARNYAPDLPDAVQDVIDGGMAKDPAQRYPSAGALADALQAALRAPATYDGPRRPVDGGPVGVAPVAARREEESRGWSPTGSLIVPRAGPQARSARPAPVEPTPGPRRWVVAGIVALLALAGLAGIVFISANNSSTVNATQTQVALLPQTSTVNSVPFAVTASPVLEVSPVLSALPDDSDLTATFNAVLSSALRDLTLTANAITPSATFTPPPSQTPNPTDTPTPIIIAAIPPAPQPVVTSAPVSGAGNWRPTGRIAFVSDQSGNPDIYVINADGTGLTNLTNNPSKDTRPAWSHDGSRLLFLSDRDIPANQRGPELYVMNANGSNVIRLTTNDSSENAAVWSPDDQRILFSTGGAVYVMKADGTGGQGVSAGTDPVWSPDGQRIALVLSAGLTVLRADGSQGVKIASGFSPAWSPDGSRIAYSPFLAGPKSGEIYLINPDGSGQMDITNDPNENEYQPNWSLDSQYIVFVSDRDGNPNLYLMRRDGSQQTRLTSQPGAEYDPYWGP